MFGSRVRFGIVFAAMIVAQCTQSSHAKPNSSVGCKNIQKSIHVIMMIDISGSEYGASCDQAKGYFKQIPALVEDSARIDLVRFDDSVLHDEFSPSSDRVAKLNHLIDGEHCFGGGTSPQLAMARAYDLFKNTASDIKVLITATDGEGNYDLQWIKNKLVDEQKVRIVVVHNEEHEYNTQKLKQIVNPGTAVTNYVRIKKNQEMTKKQFEEVLSSQCKAALN